MSEAVEFGYEPAVRVPARISSAFEVVFSSKLHRALRRRLKLTDARYAFVRASKLGDHLARYVADSRGLFVISATPFARLSERALVDEASRTLVHEYGHAYLESTLMSEERPHGDDEEEIVESFSRAVHDDEPSLALDDFLRVAHSFSAHT